MQLGEQSTRGEQKRIEQVCLVRKYEGGINNRSAAHAHYAPQNVQGAAACAQRSADRRKGQRLKKGKGVGEEFPSAGPQHNSRRACVRAAGVLKVENKARYSIR